MKEKSTKWNSLTPRILTGLFGGILVVFLLYYTSWSAYFLLSAIGLGSLWEFYQIGIKTKLIPNILIGIISALLLLLSTLFKIDFTYVIIISLFALASVETVKANSNIITTIAITVLGVIYCILPIVLFFKASFVNGSYDWRYIIALFVMIWSFDSGAYFSGKFFGKHKMIPKVSPGKTWEGTVGGAVFCFIAIYIFSNYFPIFSMIEIICYSSLISICGTFGDLFVSQMKRNIDLKDTGSILPGHGGFLDRFDGFLMAASFYSTSLLLFNAF